MNANGPAAERHNAPAAQPGPGLLPVRLTIRTLGYQKIIYAFLISIGLILIVHSLTEYAPGNLAGFLWPMGARLMILSIVIVMYAKARRGEQQFRMAEEHYREIVERSLEGIYQTSSNGRWLSANPAMARMLGYESAEEMLQADVDLNTEFYVEPGQRDEFRRLMSEQDTIQDFESEVRAKDGRRMWISESARAVRDGSGELLYYEGRTMNITARKRAEEALRTEYDRQAVWVHELETRTREIGLLGDMSSMLQSCSRLDEAYAIVAEHTRWLFPGHAGALYVGGVARVYSERVAVWGSPEPPEPFVEPEDCWAVRRGRPHRAVVPYRGALADSHPAMFCKHIHAPLPAAMLCVPLVAQGETLGLLHLRLESPDPAANGGRKDQAELYSEGQMQLAQAAAGSLAVAIANIRLQETLHEQSIRDPLTGLFNRRHLQKVLQRAVTRADTHGEQLAMLMVDIDHFKSFNDAYGHEAGDAMLHELGRFLASEIREEDFACRYGGEEFALIMPGATIQASRERAEALRKGAREITVMMRRQQLGPVSLSIGLAHIPSHAHTAQELMRAADVALYRAKNKGRDQVRLAEVRESAEVGADWT